MRGRQRDGVGVPAITIRLSRLPPRASLPFSPRVVTFPAVWILLWKRNGQGCLMMELQIDPLVDCFTESSQPSGPVLWSTHGSLRNHISGLACRALVLVLDDPASLRTWQQKS